MTEKEVKELLARYEDGNCTAEEELLLERAYIQMAMLENLPADAPDINMIRKEIYANLPVSKHSGWRIPVYLKYAAAILVLIGGLWTYQHLHYKSTAIPSPGSALTDAAQIQPGSNQAILTVAGKKIKLNTAKSGIVINPGRITYSDGAPLASPGGERSVGQKGVNQMLTASTPRGGQYRFTLPDGSIVYLNAESELNFPSAFTGSDRRVSLKGEGYFEITKDPSKPFIVLIADQQQVKVLGTHFNIRAYPMEALKTTLAEGSVQITCLSSTNPSNPSNIASTSHPIILKPDQQAVLSSSGFVLKKVRAKNQIAWKDGLFVFRQTPLPEALREIARWYNVPVETNHIPHIAISADISKTQKLADFLAVLKAGTGINIVFTKERGLFIEQ